MAEKKTHKLIPYEVHYICDECHEGEMLIDYSNETAYFIMTDPPRFTHTCVKCGATKNFTTKYPMINYEHEEIK